MERIYLSNITIFMFCMAFLFSVFVIFVFIENDYSTNNMNIACKDIEFIEYKWIKGFEYCRDIEGNLHYVYMECDETIGAWDKNCIARKISVGDVRTRAIDNRTEEEWNEYWYNNGTGRGYNLNRTKGGK